MSYAIHPTDEVRVNVNPEGHVTGTTFHTDPDGGHGPLGPHVLPKGPPDEYGNYTDYEERPSYTHVTLSTALLFGLRECQICERHRLMADNLDNLIVYKGMSKSGKIRLTVNGRSVSFSIGQAYDLSKEKVTTVPETLRPLLGIEEEGDDE